MVCSNFIDLHGAVQISQRHLLKKVSFPHCIRLYFKPLKWCKYNNNYPRFFSSVQFSRSVVTNPWRPHGLQHTRPPCPSPIPGIYSNSCLSSQWRHPTILCHPLLLPPSIFPSIRGFPSESVLCIRWPKDLSFSFSIILSNEYSGLISFRMDWLDLLAVWGTLESSSTPQVKVINSSVFSLLYSPTLTSIRDHWKNHSLD